MAVPIRRFEELLAPDPLPRPARRRPEPFIREVPREAARPVALPSGRVGRRQAPFALFALGLVTILLVALATAQALVSQSSFRLDELQRQADELTQANGQLRLRVARLSSPQRLTRAAADAGLVIPSGVEVLPVRLPADSTGEADPGATGSERPPGGGGR